MPNLIRTFQRSNRLNLKGKGPEVGKKTRHAYLIGTSLLSILLLTACGNSSSPLSFQSVSVLSQVQAAVTQTLGAMATISAQNTPTPTAAFTPTPTFTPTATPTTYSTPTQVPATSTPVTVYSYYPSSSTNYGCEDSAFVKDMTIPDGTVLAPGETFTKTWKLQNTGSCKWNSYYSIAFVSGNNMDGNDTGISQTVLPGKRAEISVELTAPDTEGTYYGYWQLMDPYGNTFGETVYVEIVVEAPTSTPTPTDVMTSTSTATTLPTSAPTIVPTATETEQPASTPTATPTPSSTSTPANVVTSTPTATTMPTSTPTIVPTATETEQPTFTPTATSVPTSTPTAVPTKTRKHTPTPTATLAEVKN